MTSRVRSICADNVAVQVCEALKFCTHPTLNYVLRALSDFPPSRAVAESDVQNAAPSKCNHVAAMVEKERLFCSQPEPT